MVLRGRELGAESIGAGSIECLVKLQQSVWNGGGLRCVVLKSSGRKSEWRICWNFPTRESNISTGLWLQSLALGHSVCDWLVSRYKRIQFPQQIVITLPSISQDDRNSPRAHPAPVLE